MVENLVKIERKMMDLKLSANLSEKWKFLGDFFEDCDSVNLYKLPREMK
jgi:hypothetical protein